jgi:hypothetical protein
MFGETFQRNSALSLLQIKSYEVALADLSVGDLDRACEETLRTWSYAGMPQPAFIRKCLRSVAEVEEFEEFSGVPQLTYDDSATEEERIAELKNPEYQKLKAKICVVVEQKKPQTKLPADTDRLLIADRARMKELERQKEILRQRGFKIPTRYSEAKSA